MIFKSKLKQPINFIVCGTQKGGTTALDYYLRSHQEICMALKKEVHFLIMIIILNMKKLIMSFIMDFSGLKKP